MSKAQGYKSQTHTHRVVLRKLMFECGDNQIIIQKQMQMITHRVFGKDAFELWCWRVPWTARRSNQPILKEINHEYSLEGLVLKLKLQYFGTKWEEPIHWKRPWCWERLRARREWDDRGWDGCMVSLIQWIWVSANSGRWWRTGKPGVLQLMGLQRVRHCLFRLFSNWTITVSLPLSVKCFHSFVIHLDTPHS